MDTRTHTQTKDTNIFKFSHGYSLTFLCLALCPSFHRNVTCVGWAHVAACRGRRTLRNAAETSQAHSQGRGAKVWKLLSVLFTWHSHNLLPLPERPSTCTMLPPSADAAIINEKHAEARNAAAIAVEIRHLHLRSADSMASWGCWVYRGENWPDVCDNVSYILKEIKGLQVLVGDSLPNWCCPLWRQGASPPDLSWETGTGIQQQLTFNSRSLSVHYWVNSRSMIEHWCLRVVAAECQQSKQMIEFLGKLLLGGCSSSIVNHYSDRYFSNCFLSNLINLSLCCFNLLLNLQPETTPAECKPSI